MKRLLNILLFLALIIVSCEKSAAPDSIGSEPFAEQSAGDRAIHSFRTPMAGENTGYFAVEIDSWRVPFIAIAELGGLAAWASPNLPEWTVGTRTITLKDSGDATSFTVVSEETGRRILPDRPFGILAMASVPGSGNYITAHADGSVVLAGRDKPIVNPAAFIPVGPVFIASSDDACLVSGGDGIVVALNLADLTERWRVPGRAGPQVVSGDAAFWVGDDEAIHVTSMENGTALSSIPLTGASRFVVPAWDGSDLYLAMEDGSVTALHPGTGMERWRSRTGFSPDFLVLDQDSLFVFGKDSALAISRSNGVDMIAVPIPNRAASRPVIWNGLLVYPGVDGRMYANRMIQAAMTDSARFEVSLARGIAFKLEKYLVQPGAVVMEEGFLPYVDFSPHDGRFPFSVFVWDVQADSGDRVLEAWEGDGSAVPEDAIIVLFDERGNELRSNIDEFGAHPSYSHWIDSGRRYYIALGRRDAPRPPLFLRIRNR
ncbi:MAG: hypothetical protein E4H20_09890 [Spirochaetales bacterium]|nr:MAG: hypothetical protein E4H20_09890 [Spirochaetales bacterium]